MLELPIWIALCIAGCFGLAIGSLTNVVISRIPVMNERRIRTEAHEILGIEAPESTTLNLFWPRSHCPSCQTPIRLLDLIPIVSWILIRGKCTSCGADISVRYPIVEAIVCGLVVWIVAIAGMSVESLFLIAAVVILTALAIIDFEHGQLPNELSYPLLFLGLLACVLLPTSRFLATVDSAAIGAIAGYLSFWLINHGFKLAIGRNGMGEGDFKLHAAIGAWVGWQLLPMLVVIAFALGIVYGLWELVRGRYSSEEGIPFGPFLATAAVSTILLREQLMHLIALSP